MRPATRLRVCPDRAEGAGQCRSFHATRTDVSIATSTCAGSEMVDSFFAN
jgi:hypothetical protein